jgi:hypothetical protein
MVRVTEIHILTPATSPDYIIRRGDFIRWMDNQPFIEAEMTVGSTLGKHRCSVEVLCMSPLLDCHYVNLPHDHVLREDKDQFSFRGGPWRYVGDVFSGCTVGSILDFFGGQYRFRTLAGEC